MSLAVVTSWDAAYADLAAVTVPNHEAYCRQHGYTYWGQLSTNSSRHPVWGRVQALQSALEHFDFVAALDIDAIFTNFALPIQEFMTHDCIVTADENGLNAGVSLWRSCEWSRRFVASWLDAEPYYRRFLLQDQTALAYKLIAEPQERWRCIPQKGLNSFRSHWGPEDLILHLADVPNAERIVVFKSVLVAIESSDSIRQ